MFIAITRVDIAQYVDSFIFVYTILIFASILLTWLPQPPQSPLLSAVVRFIRDVTDPYLRMFRRLIPPIGIGRGALDLSPIVALIVLFIIQRIVPPLIAG